MPSLLCLGGFGSSAGGADVSTAALHRKLRTCTFKGAQYVSALCERQAGTDAEEQLLSLSVCPATGVSWWFANCQTNRPRVSPPPPLALRSLQPALPEKIYYSGELEEQRRSRWRRAGCRRRSSREIYGCQAALCCTVCARVCVSVRYTQKERGPFKRGRVLSIEKRVPNNGFQVATRACAPFIFIAAACFIA